MLALHWTRVSLIKTLFNQVRYHNALRGRSLSLSRRGCRAALLDRLLQLHAESADLRLLQSGLPGGVQEHARVHVLHVVEGRTFAARPGQETHQSAVRPASEECLFGELLTAHAHRSTPSTGREPLGGSGRLGCVDKLNYGGEEIQITSLHHTCTFVMLHYCCCRRGGGSFQNERTALLMSIIYLLLRCSLREWVVNTAEECTRERAKDWIPDKYAQYWKRV